MKKLFILFMLCVFSTSIFAQSKNFYDLLTLEQLIELKAQVEEAIELKKNNAETAAVSENKEDAAENKEEDSGSEKKAERKFRTEPVTVRVSNDKSKAYVKDYVGKNAGSVGYTSLGGERLDKYGKEVVKLIYVTECGTYLDIEEENTLKKYVVYEQSIEPDTEIKFGYQKKNSYETCNFRGLRDIKLYVKLIKGEESHAPVALVYDEEKVSPDRETAYVKNYIGLNLYSCGYVSLGGELRDRYNEETVELSIITEDGTNINVSADNASKLMKKYYVIDQNIKAGSKITMVYEKSSYGSESCSFISLKEIDLLVRKIDEEPAEDRRVKSLTKIPVSDNRETAYVKDYTGKNVMQCGYSSLGGDRLDYYNAETIKLILVAPNGEDVNISDEKQMKKYVVKSQSVKPGEIIKFEYRDSSWGRVLDSKTLQEISLYLEEI